MANIANDDSSEYFQHDPLDLDHPTIRLARLQPTRLSTINIILEHHRTDSCPKYRALSYVWGPPQPSDTIIVNNKAFIVRRNLFDFLSMYGKHIEQETYIWIDQLCIDQSHVTERNHQVGLMGKVFSGAIGVLAWLGPSEGCDVFKALHAADFDSQERVKWHISRDDTNYDEELSHERDRDRVFATAFQHLANNQYWTRLWIVQELVLARHVVYFLGPSHRREEQVVAWLQRSSILHKSLFDQDFKSKARVMEKLISGGRWDWYHSLASVVIHFSTLDCEDPRDKVFGLMGIIEGEKGMVVDYTAPIESIFAETCIHIAACDGTAEWEHMNGVALVRMSDESRKVLSEQSSDRLATAILNFRDMCLDGHQREGASVLEPYLDATAFQRLSSLGLLKTVDSNEADQRVPIQR